MTENGIISIDKNIYGISKNVQELEGFVPFDSMSTKAITVGHNPFDHPGTGHLVIPPICLSTTFQQKEPGVGKYDYSRGNNYNRESLEAGIAALENGQHCAVFSSGLATTNALVQLLKQGDHVICNEDVYGGTNRFFRKIFSQFGVEAEMVDLTKVAALEAAIKPNTQMVWLETPTNPLMRLVDIKAIADAAHARNSEIIVVADNTFLTPIFQRPLSLGADVAMHSLTKYVNGHTDVVMGAAITNRKDIYERLNFIQLAAGAVPSPFDCFLCQRGLRTLNVRMREHMRNGLAVARFLEQHHLVEKVIHPGLKSHPQYELGRRQMRGYSGMVTMYIKGGLEEATAFLKTVKIFHLAESLGGFESLIEVPSVMTHASVPPEQRATLGISDNLIRLSVGLEDLEDQLHDLEQALQASVVKSK